MLRMLLAIAFILYGARQALRGPFHGLLFYLAIAYFRPETWVWGDQLQSLNLSFIVGLYVVIATVLSQNERLRWNLPVGLMILLCLHSLVGTLVSGHVEWSFFWWKGFAKTVLITTLIVSLVNTERRFRLTVLVISLALGFESVKQGWAFILLQQAEANLNSVEILGDNNGVAVGMLMLTSVLLAMLQTSPRFIQKAGFAFMAIGAVARALATFSRGGLLSLGAMCAVYWTRSRHRFAMGLVIAVIAGGLLSMMPQRFWDRMGTITTDQEQMETSSAGRVYFWGLAVRMANDHPLLGVGNAGFQARYDDYDESHGAYGHGRAVHSTWFGMLAEQGYVGLTIFVWIIVLAFVAAGRARRLTVKQPVRIMTFTFAGAMQAALITVVVGGTFLSYHYVEILWHFLGLSFAIRQIAEQPVAAADVVPVRAATPIAGVPALATYTIPVR